MKIPGISDLPRRLLDHRTAVPSQWNSTRKAAAKITPDETGG